MPHFFPGSDPSAPGVVFSSPASRPLFPTARNQAWVFANFRLLALSTRWTSLSVKFIASLVFSLSKLFCISPIISLTPTSNPWLSLRIPKPASSPLSATMSSMYVWYNRILCKRRSRAAIRREIIPEICGGWGLSRGMGGL